jgi:transcriptional regulator with XRE-family HTH domain
MSEAGSPPSYLRRIRLLRGESLSTVSKRAGITRQALAAIEQGRTQPRLQTMIAVSRALEESPSVCFPELLER